MDKKTERVLTNMIDYCDENIIELLKMEKVLKPYESLNRAKLNQLMFVKEFLQRWRKKQNDNL